MTRRSLFALATAGLAGQQKDQPVKKNDLYNIPADLPVPVDDGACRHLVGMPVPMITLVSTANRRVNMAEAPISQMYLVLERKVQLEGQKGTMRRLTAQLVAPTVRRC